MGFFLICVPVKITKLHYFVIWHYFSYLQWNINFIFNVALIVFASQSVQWPTTRSWIFTIFWVICSSLPNVTSHQQTDVPNIVQAKNYPEVRTFWRLFYWPKMAESSYLLSHFNAMSDNTCLKPGEGYILLGAFESALCRSNHFVFSKWLFLKGIWL